MVIERLSHGQHSTMNTTIKGLSQSQNQYDGSSMRVAIIHARWNKTVIDALVAGAIAKLKERGVKEKNIVVESVPGSFELPLACAKCVIFQRVISYS
jgi:6,7-dimethyl-8-ribityllumazine synthase